jgi:hypothetical protein
MKTRDPERYKMFFMVDTVYITREEHGKIHGRGRSKGIILTENHRKKISEALKGKPTVGVRIMHERRIGTHHSEASKKKSQLAQPHRKIIIIRGVEYPSILAASRALGISCNAAKKIGEIK